MLHVCIHVCMFASVACARVCVCTCVHLEGDVGILVHAKYFWFICIRQVLNILPVHFDSTGLRREIDSLMTNQNQVNKEKTKD